MDIILFLIMFALLFGTGYFLGSNTSEPKKKKEKETEKEKNDGELFILTDFDVALVNNYVELRNNTIAKITKLKEEQDEKLADLASHLKQAHGIISFNINPDTLPLISVRKRSKLII